MHIHKDELILEVERNGKWFSPGRGKHISDDDARWAVDELAKTPERYVYPPWMRGRARISYAEN